MLFRSQHLFDSPNHNWCFQCSRDFSSQTALLNVSVHDASSIHNLRYCSIKTPLPIADAILNAPSAKGCSRVLRALRYTSSQGATRKSLDTTSLPPYMPWISFPTSPSNALRDLCVLPPCAPISPPRLLSMARRTNVISVTSHSELYRVLTDT